MQSCFPLGKPEPPCGRPSALCSHRQLFHCLFCFFFKQGTFTDISVSENWESDLISFFLSFFFFLMWTIFKVFIEFVTVLLLFYVLVFSPQGMWDLSSPTKDRTCTPCIRRQSLNHWTAREVPPLLVKHPFPWHPSQHPQSWSVMRSTCILSAGCMFPIWYPVIISCYLLCYSPDNLSLTPQTTFDFFIARWLNSWVLL